MTATRLQFPEQASVAEDTSQEAERRIRRSHPEAAHHSARRHLAEAQAHTAHPEAAALPMEAARHMEADLPVEDHPSAAAHVAVTEATPEAAAHHSAVAVEAHEWAEAEDSTLTSAGSSTRLHPQALLL